MTVRRRNERLAAVIAEASWSHAQVANAFVRVALEASAREFATVGRSHVSHWVGGTSPTGSGRAFLAEALSRRLGRTVTTNEIGLGAGDGVATAQPSWDLDTLATLADLGRIDVDVTRRAALGAAAYSAAAVAVPDPAWWAQISRRGGQRGQAGRRLIGRGDLEAVQETARLLSQIDQRRGGGHARVAVAQYLTADISGYMRGTYADDSLRRQMFSTAGELSYLAGWMAFDNAEHALAQHYFSAAVKLAAEADDPPLAGHILRAMAHQALDLGHRNQALVMAVASTEGKRSTTASPRERALTGVVHARALAACGNRTAASSALLDAERHLESATPDGEPDRVFFFGEASLAHETARTLRELGDVSGSVREFRRSVRTRKADAFARTHVVTLGYLGSSLAGLGSIEEACKVWSDALTGMDGIRSARARQVALDMRSELAAFAGRGVRSVRELDARAATYLASA